MTCTRDEVKRAYYQADPAKIQRLGQWFIANFFPLETDPDLFYEKDPEKALDLIMAKYSTGELNQK
jgi:hypothetical protein